MSGEPLSRATPPAGAQPVLRDMQLADLRQVMSVERAAYEFPWTEGIFRDCLRVGYVCRVLEQSECNIGHGIMSIGAGECHLLNICVHPVYQRRGFGRALVLHLLEIARLRQVRMALLEVRRSNVSAYRLYSDLGFNEIGMRRHYYPAHRGREDAIVLALEL